MKVHIFDHQKDSRVKTRRADTVTETKGKPGFPNTILASYRGCVMVLRELSFS
jgi:hypothetical protein